MHGNLPRILFVILVAIAGYLIWQQQSQLFADRGRLVTSHEGGAVVLSWHHDIEVPMERRFREAFAEWGNKAGTFIIDLSSPGGALLEGRNVIEAINEMKTTHTIITRVGSKAICLSMCVPIYLQGQKRIAARDSTWMFHEPSAYDYFSGEESELPEFEREHNAERFFDRYFANSEMDPKWAARLKQEWKGAEVWRTGAQLVSEGSNIVLELR